MSKETEILDNRTRFLGAFLRKILADASLFRVVTAYFSIRGYGALKEQLDADDLQVRFLYGVPETLQSTPLDQLLHKTFALSEAGLEDNGLSLIKQHDLAQECLAWVSKPEVKVRTISERNLLHGKMYHAEAKNDKRHAVVGSSNFTHRGLGTSSNPNLELNMIIKDEGSKQSLAHWFDAIWEDAQDAKQDLQDALQRYFDQHPPRLMYFKTLYEMYKKQLDKWNQPGGASSERKLQDAEVWGQLYDFQKHGAQAIIRKLINYRCCFLADSVGLGKTYTALAVIKFFELNGDNVLVLSPKKLINNWNKFHSTYNPFPKDRFKFTLKAHTDLSKSTGHIDGVIASDYDWSRFDLIVIDESHNFRNESPAVKDVDGNKTRSGRHEKLLKSIQASNAKVLFLTATPVNNSLEDMHNQLHLVTGRKNDFFKESLGVTDLSNVISEAQKHYDTWVEKSQGSEEDLLDVLSDDLRNLLGALTLARSRKQIQKFYRETGDFPKRQVPESIEFDIDVHNKISFENISNNLLQAAFNLYKSRSFYRNSSEEDRRYDSTVENFLRVNLFKRLESSVSSLKISLDKLVDKIDKEIENPRGAADLSGMELDEEGEETDLGINKTYLPSELDVERWRSALRKDKERFKAILEEIQHVDTERDSKLQKLIKYLREKSKKPNKKVVIFSTFKDTAKYIYDHIVDAGLEGNKAFVSGDEYKNTLGRSMDYEAILDAFSPEGRNRGLLDASQQIDILVATDCISEGQNLHDCDTVINYDIHWNPVRLIQRFGRIDRIGSKNEFVQMVNFWPPNYLEKHLNLKERVMARMTLADIAATGSDNILSNNNAGQQMELFRNKQVEELLSSNEIIEADDLQKAWNFSSFAPDLFIAQLQEFLRKNKEKLEKIPSGAYAVTNVAKVAELPARDEEHQAIYCFRHTLSQNNPEEAPEENYYLIHAGQDKVIRGWKNNIRILHTYDELTSEQEAIHQDLCDDFIRSTRSQEDLAMHSSMVMRAVDYIANSRANEAHRSGVFPRVQDQPSKDNLELVSWLVIPPQINK